MAERPPITDLSGGNESADSLTRLIANLVAEYAVDFQFDPASSVAFGLTVFSEGFDCSSCAIPTTDCGGSRAASSALRKRTVRENPLSTLVHIPLDCGFCEVIGTGVGEIEDPILRSDSE